MTSSPVTLSPASMSYRVCDVGICLSEEGVTFTSADGRTVPVLPDSPADAERAALALEAAARWLRGEHAPR